MDFSQFLGSARGGNVLIDFQHDLPQRLTMEEGHFAAMFIGQFGIEFLPSAGVEAPHIGPGMFVVKDLSLVVFDRCPVDGREHVGTAENDCPRFLGFDHQQRFRHHRIGTGIERQLAITVKTRSDENACGLARLELLDGNFNSSP